MVKIIFKKERKFKNFFRTIEIFFQVFLTLAFQTISFFAILLEFANFKKDTFGLTNYGFAIMLGLSSVCFSWARNLSSENHKAKQVNNNAITALYGAIIFLLGSSFKYVAMSTGDTFPLSIIKENLWIVYTLKGFAFICFLIAIMNFAEVTSDILRIVGVSKDEEWEEELKMREKYKESLQKPKKEEIKTEE